MPPQVPLRGGKHRLHKRVQQNGSLLATRDKIEFVGSKFMQAIALAFGQIFSAVFAT
jgi:hypothetical protein